MKTASGTAEPAPAGPAPDAKKKKPAGAAAEPRRRNPRPPSEPKTRSQRRGRRTRPTRSPERGTRDKPPPPLAGRLAAVSPSRSPAAKEVVMAKGQMRVPKEKKKPKADKDKPKQTVRLQAVADAGRVRQPLRQPARQEGLSAQRLLPACRSCGRPRADFAAAGHFQAGEQFDIARSAAELRQCHAMRLLRGRVLPPLLLQLAARGRSSRLQALASRLGAIAPRRRAGKWDRC